LSSNVFIFNNLPFTVIVLKVEVGKKILVITFSPSSANNSTEATSITSLKLMVDEFEIYTSYIDTLLNPM